MHRFINFNSWELVKLDRFLYSYRNSNLSKHILLVMAKIAIIHYYLYLLLRRLSFDPSTLSERTLDI